jgi:cytochrome P450
MDTMDSPDAPKILAGDWFNVFEPEFRIDPYRYYRRLRQEDPIHWGTSYEPSIPGMWHIARYADCRSACPHPASLISQQSIYRSQESGVLCRSIRRLLFLLLSGTWPAFRRQFHTSRATAASALCSTGVLTVRRTVGQFL